MGSRYGRFWQQVARGAAAAGALALAAVAPAAAQVGYSDGFESCGEDPAGWFDSAPGNPTQEAPGQFKIWTDPRAAGNHAFGKRGASDSYSHYRDATFGADSAFLWIGRVYRERTASLAGMMFFSTAPTPVAYFQLGQVASNGTVRLSSVNRGALTGDTETGVVLTPNRWFRFAIAAAPLGDGVRITASVWPDGDPQPESWQVDATAPGAPAGWIGLWASGNGSKLWDDFDVSGGGGGGEPLAIEIREGGQPLEDGAVFARAVTPTIATTGGTAPVELTATLDGAPFSSGSTVDTDGDHTLAASASDAAGGSAAATVHFSIDRTGPVFLSVLPADGSVTAEGSVTLSGEVSGAETVTVDGAAASLSGALFTAGPFALAEGERTFLLIATDAAGNATERLHRIVRDGTAPELSVQSPLPGAVVGATPIAVSGTAVDPRLAAVTVNGQPASVGGAVWVLAALDLVPGGNAITVRATDSVGNAAEVALEVILDTEPPVVRILESGAPLADGALFDRPVTPVIETEDATAVTVEATLDGAPFVSGSTVAADGEHLLAVIATDAGGSSTALSVRFRIDTTPPQFVSTQPEPGALVATSELTITGVVTGATSVTVDGSAATLAGDAFSAGPFALSDGPRTFQLAAADEAGNSATLALAIERDGTAPTLAVTAPAPGTVVAAATIDVAGTVADPHLDEVRVAGIPAVVSGGQFTAAGVPLAEGGNDLVVVARDTLGNSVEVTVAVTRDSEPPAVAVLEQGVPLADGALFARAVVPVVEATDATEITLVLRLDGQPFVSGTSVATEGERRLEVEATDEAGNLTARTVRFTIDTTAPVVASVEPPSGTVTREATVVVSGRAVGAATVRVDGVDVPLAGDAFASAPIALAEGERTIPVVAIDAAGNQATQSVTVVRDTTAPTLAITQPAAGAVSGAASTEVVGTVSDPNLDAVTVNGVAAAVTGGSFVAAGVPLAEGLNTLTARAVDRAGNAVEASRDVERDSTAPTVAILDPAAGTVVPDATIEVRGTAADAHLDRVEVQGVPATLVGEQWSIEVALAEGETTLVARAIDTLGRDAEASVVVRRDSTAPELEITAPAEGARIAAAEVAIEGTVEVEEGLTVTVNGVAATVTGGTFSATVPLAAGENRLIARARDAQGNTGTRTRIVWRDDAAPRLLSADPPDGAVGLAPNARFRLTFSEPMAAPAAGALVLETADGTPLAATATVSAATIEVVPAAALPSAATLRLRLTTALADLSGRALEAEQLLTFETSDGEAPAPPVVAPGTPERLCGASVALAGTAEPGGTIEATGGAWPVSAPVDSAGGFELAVPLAVERPNALALTVVDATGNRSDAASWTVVHDCTPPRVLAALPAAQAVTIVFSEELDAASIAGAVTVDDLHGPLAGTEALGADAASIVWSAAEPLPETPFRVEVSTAVTDLAGNPLAYPWSQLLGGGAAASFLSGVVLDDATGRPLEGVRVQAFRTNGTPLAPPWPEQTSGPDGRFSLAMPAGTHQILFERAGYTTAWRTVTTEPDRGTDVFDPRLSPIGTHETVADGGALLAREAAPGGVAAITLDVPGGAYAAPTAVALVSFSEQGLPALLPYGWSPRAAVWWWGATPATAPSTLTIEVEPGVAPHRALVRFDLGALAWRVEQLLDPATTLAVLESPGDGAWAVVDADPAPFVVPAPAVGQLLPSLAPPPFDLVTAAAIVFTPETVLPDQTALAEVTYSGSDEAASGTPLALAIAEELELLDGTVRIEPPYPADLILYRAPDGTAGSAFRLKPSEAARLLPLDQGEEQVAVAHYAGETVRGNVLGPDGDTVTDEDGNRIEIPAGALLAPTPVALAAVDPVAAGAPLPAWLEPVAALDVDLSGRTLAQSATLTFAVAPAPGSGERGLVLERFATPDGPRWRPVAAAEPVAEGWRSTLAAPAGWPGIRGGGVFLVARAVAPFGYFSGRVFDVTGTPLDGAAVDAATSGTLRQRSGPAGAYLLPAPVGATAVSARESLRNNGVTIDSAVPADAAVVPLDLPLAVVAPTVVLVTPADGAVEIPVGVEPQVTFSEAIDPATASEIELLTANGSTIPIDRIVQGALVTLVPDGDLEAGTPHEIAIGAGVRDLQGYGLGTAVSSTFLTVVVAQPGGLDPSRVLLYEPDAAGRSRVQGLAGAVDPGLLVFVENLTRFASTESMEAGPSGQFDLEIEAAVGDHLRLHVIIPGANEVVLTLGPYRTADGRGAWIGPTGAVVTTVDGWTLDVPAGTFATVARVAVTPRPASAPAPAQPETFVRTAGFTLDFGGVTATKAIELTLPAPAGTPDEEHLVLREVSALGRRGWMLHAFARLDGANLTTRDEPAPLANLPENHAALGTGDAGKGGDAPPTSHLRPPGWRNLLPGLAFAGNYTLSYSSEPIGFFSMPLVAGIDAAIQTSLEGLLTVVNAAIEALLSGDAILIPTHLGPPVSFTILDLNTGFTLFEGEFEPPADEGGFVELPPALYGDEEPAHPVGGSPIRFFVVTAEPGASGALDLGVTYVATDEELTVTGTANAMGAELKVRLLGLDGEDESAFTTSEADGSFSLSTEIVAGQRYLVALGARITPEAELVVEFDEPMAEDFPGLDVIDAAGHSVVPEKVARGTRARAVLRPRTAWRAGETFRLALTPELADASGNVWDHNFSIEFEVESSGVADTHALGRAQDIARLGNLLFVAADEQGLAVLDVSDPTNLTGVLPGDATFLFPMQDLVRGVAVDPHGRVLVAGGGSRNFGILRIFDPLRLPEILAAPDPIAARGLAWRGTTIISDRIGGTGTQLPPGYPRRVTVLSNDLKSAWIDGGTVPVEFTVQPIDPAPGERRRIRVLGAGASPNAPVTLRNLDRLGWERVDADGSGNFTVELAAEPGDRLELLRNRESFAYVATLGVGIEVVDVNRFYRPDDTPAPGWTDLLGFYSGAGDPNLILCNQQVPDLSSALIDLGGLFDVTSSHPLTAVGLVAFRGLALVASQPNDIGDLGFVEDACANVSGSRAVFGLETAVDLALDWDGVPGISEEERHSDWALVAHGVGGLLVYDLTERTNPVLRGRVPLPGSALHLGLDRSTLRVYVATGSQGLMVVDLSGPLLVGFIDEDGDGVDDRVIERIQLPGIDADAPVAILPELGMVFAGGEGGVASVAAGRPRLDALGKGSDDVWKRIEKLAPMGVPAPDAEDPRSGAAAIRVRAAIPGQATPELRMRIAGTSPAGLTFDGAGVDLDLPKTELAGDEAGLLFRRLSDRIWEEGSSVYLSEEVAVLADLRAAKLYERTTRENDTSVPGHCVRCDRTALAIDPEARELLSGDEVRVTFEGELGQRLTDLYGPARLATSELALPSVRWETAPSLRQEPALNPSFGNGEVVPGTLLHSGEFSHAATDLFVKGRGLDFAFTRTYRNQTVGGGPLGPGWDFGYRLRLRALPNGDVELYDGRGRRETFKDFTQTGYLSPPGVVAELIRDPEGWLLLDPSGSKTRFDRHGRLVSVADPVSQGPDTGNQLHFTHDAYGRLIEIEDSLDRRYEFAYEDLGRLTTVRDFTGREVRFEYDADGRLVRATSPTISTGTATFPEGLTTEYVYEPTSGALASRLSLGNNLLSIVDPRGEVPFENTFEDRDEDGRIEEIASQTWGGHPVTLTYDFGLRETLVHDRRENLFYFRHDAGGHSLTQQDPFGAALQRTYLDDTGIVLTESLPLGRTFNSEPSANPTPMTALQFQWQKVVPDDRGANGSAQELTTTYAEYRMDFGPPEAVHEPNGLTTLRDFNPTTKLLEGLTEGFASPVAAATRFEYNPYGQLTKVTNANDHVTEYFYYETGPSRGYLQRTVVDPAGVALETRFETDVRGNVTAVIDGRGVRHRFVYNEVDWLVETIEAETPASDGAPALQLRTLYLHDENGNVVEERIPYGDEGGFTKIERDVGPLNELLEERKQILPDLDEFAVDRFEYDENLNLVAHVDGEGSRTEWTYDERNLVETQTRGAGTIDAVIERWTYTLDREVETFTDGRGKVWSRFYDGYGRVRETRDPLGRRELIEYDDAGLPTRVRRLEADGHLLSQSESEYDVRKRLTEHSEWIWPSVGRNPGDLPLEEPPSDAAIAVTRYEYDALSNPKKTIDPIGRETVVFYDTAERRKRVVDAAGNEVESYFDPAGNPTLVRSREVLPGGGSADVTELRKFDALGRPVEVINGAGETVRTILDARGNPRFVIDPAGHFTEMRYDGLDRMTFRARPQGITEESVWDRASRLVTYRDALGQETTWSYDALNRVTGVTYEDATLRSFSYDGTDNVVEQVDPSGTRTIFGYDDAGQLTSRTYEPGEGIEGLVAETFELDGLGRVVRAHSGVETAERSYDSLSRMLSETFDARTVFSEYNLAGDRITLTYPSGKVVAVGPDALGRPAAIGALEGDLNVPKAAYGFRGPDLVQSLAVGEGLAWSRQFDGARRPVGSTLTGGSDRPLFGEDHVWSARGLRQSTARASENGAALRFDYDGAGRLTRARRSVLEGEQAIPASGWPGLPEEHAFGYDAADNLLSKLEQSTCEPETVTLPLDGSGRNRPGAIGETQLAWSANGNLALAGERRFVYDAKDRLVAVEDASSGLRLVEYRYDAFDRRIGKALSTGLTEETVWDGWQPIEVYRNDQLASRRTYGWGLDEVVSLEQDVDWAAGVEEEFVPVYDETGNVALLLRPDGQVVERYEYGPYGERRILVDSTPPVVEQVRTEGDELWLELSEEVRLDDLERAKDQGTLTFTNLTDGSPVDFELVQPVERGRNARKRLVLRSHGDPEESFWPEAGETASLTIPAEAFVDLFGNEATGGITRSFTATGASQLLDDTAAPGVAQICVTADGKLEVTLDEEPAVAGWASVARIDGAPLAWELQADRYTVRTTAPIATGTHDLVILDFGPVDLDGKPLVQAITTAFEITETSGAQTLYALPIPGEVEISTVGNVLGLHGLTHDPETDLVYVRNRYLDPRMGRFLTTDPMGYADSVSLYQFALNNPVNFSDPTGTVVFVPLAVFAAKAILAGATAWYVGNRVIDRFDQITDLDPHANLGEAGVQSLGLGVADTFGATSVYEGIRGAEVLTGASLSIPERLQRGGLGTVQLGLSMVGGAAIRGARGAIPAQLSPLSRVARVALRGPLEKLGRLTNLPLRKPLTFGIRAQRSFITATRQYLPLGASPIGRVLRRMPGLRRLRWQQSHVFGQQRFWAAGSRTRWYPNNPAADLGLRRLGNAGANLIPLPRTINAWLARHPWASFGVGLSAAGSLPLAAGSGYELGEQFLAGR
jgi:RHS repeat-associated protein